MDNIGTVGGDDTHKIWDLPLRLFHWLLVATLIGSCATQQLGTAWMEWHVRLGYLALGLVTFRLLWGFIGSRHARFTNFMTAPRKAGEYARDLVAGRPKAFAGHSPLAGWAVVAMLVSVAAQTISGLFQSDDFLTAGPWHHAAPEWLRDLMHEIHELNLFVLISLITLHLAAIAHYRWRLGSDMLQGMITGRRLVPAKEGINSDRLFRGLLAAMIAAAIVWLVVTSAPQPDPNALFQ